MVDSQPITRLGEVDGAAAEQAERWVNAHADDMGRSFCDDSFGYGALIEEKRGGRVIGAVQHGRPFVRWLAVAPGRRGAGLGGALRERLEFGDEEFGRLATRDPPRMRNCLREPLTAPQPAR